MNELSRQRIKELRRVQNAELYPPPPPMVRMGKRRPRAELRNQPPMSGGARLSVYEKQNGTAIGSHHLTPRQRRRFIKKSRANHPELYRDAA